MSRFTLPLVCILFAGIHGFAHATVIWSDTFDGQAAGTRPSLDFAGGMAGVDYSIIASSANADFLVSDSIGNPVPGLSLTDIGTGTADLTTLVVTMSHFAPFDVSPLSATPVLRLSFDFRVDSYLAGTNTQNTRFILRADNTNATGKQIVIGFSYANLNDGDADTGDLAFFADTLTGATSNLPPKNGTAIGLIPGAGWLPGFDFGAYDSGDASANDSNDEYYRVALEYDSVTGAITGSLTQISSGFVAAFPAGLQLTPGTSFSANADDRFLLASSASNTATAQFDNFVVEAVPEPGSAAVLIGGLAFASVRRRRAQG